MKTILGIIASPRKLGNSEIVIKEVATRTGVDHHLKLLRLSDFTIRHCIGCYRCLFREGGCFQKDDFARVADALAEADGWILAAPTYLLGANAALKNFMDRGLGLYHLGERLWKKPAVGISLAGMEGKEGHCKLGVDSFLRLMMAEVRASVVMYAALPGEVLLSEENRLMVDRLGRALFGEPLPAASPRCPLCGGDTFRFLGGDQVRCMLCSNAGVLRPGEEGPRFEIEPSGHDLFLCEADALSHKQWLQDMKRRFKEQKEQLKEITLRYRKGGEWIRPAEAE